MPGSQREVVNAEEEGVVFEWLTAPKAFVTDLRATDAENPGNASGPVKGVMVQKMRLGAPDATGRQAPELIEGSDYVEEADLVIMALGFEPEDLPTMFGDADLPVNRWGTIKADYITGATALDGVYAVGDIVRGGVLMGRPQLDTVRMVVFRGIEIGEVVVRDDGFGDAAAPDAVGADVVKAVAVDYRAGHV